MWKLQLDAAIVRAEHLAEVKGNDIRKYMVKTDMGDREVLQIRPIQIMHRKTKYGERIHRKLHFGPKGTTCVAVAPKGNFKQRKLIVASRTKTTRVAHVAVNHVK